MLRRDVVRLSSVGVAFGGVDYDYVFFVLGVFVLRVFLALRGGHDHHRAIREPPRVVAFVFCLFGVTLPFLLSRRRTQPLHFVRVAETSEKACQSVGVGRFVRGIILVVFILIRIPRRIPVSPVTQTHHRPSLHRETQAHQFA